VGVASTTRPANRFEAFWLRAQNANHAKTALGILQLRFNNFVASFFKAHDIYRRGSLGEEMPL